MSRSFAQILLLAVVAGHQTTVSQVEPSASLTDHYRSALVGRQAISNTSIGSGETTGLLLAEQCARRLVSWNSASTDWSISHTSPYISTGTETQPAWTTAIVPRYRASSLTMLCDGHPRVVGFGSSTSDSTTILGTSGISTTSMYTVTDCVYNIPPFPTPQAPCTISDEDCQALYNKNSSLVYASYNPICNITSTSTTPTYSTDPAGQTCLLCYVKANSAQLLYWPVRTVDGSGNLCNSSIQTQGLSSTADGPNTFVTGGVTITSPSVGIYLASVSRADGCYTTLASTIVVVPPSEVLSARGARALYNHEPFQYQDLNYKCQPANSSKSWIQDEPGNDCYQQVPAAAYFSGESAFGWDEYYPTAVGPPLTIGPDYRPYILPPASMTDWANSIFSTSGCEIQVDGVWDPPRALLPGTTVLTPVVAWGTATSTIAVSTSSASPAEVDHSQPAETTASQVISTATAVADSLGSEQTSRTESSGLTTVIITSEIRSALSCGAEAQSTAVVMTESESSSSVGESVAAATPNTASIGSDVETFTMVSENVSPSADLPTTNVSTTHESTPSESFTPVVGTQVTQSVSTSGHATELSSTHASEPTSLKSSPSNSSPLRISPAVSSPVTFQGQAAGLEISGSLALLLPIIALWL